MEICIALIYLVHSTINWCLFFFFLLLMHMLLEERFSVFNGHHKCLLYHHWVPHRIITYYIYIILLYGYYMYLHPNASMGFPGGSDGKDSACYAGDPGSIPGLRRSPVILWFYSLIWHMTWFQKLPTFPTSLRLLFPPLPFNVSTPIT